MIFKLGQALPTRRLCELEFRASAFSVLGVWDFADIELGSCVDEGMRAHGVHGKMGSNQQGRFAAKLGHLHHLESVFFTRCLQVATVKT